jgi:hypothetical protein
MVRLQEKQEVTSRAWGYPLVSGSAPPLAATLLVSLGCVFTPLAVQGKCMSSEQYEQQPAKWVKINPGRSLAGVRSWPPEGQYVLFYFDEKPLPGARGELQRFRIGYVRHGSCDTTLTGQGISMLFPPFQSSVYEPTHWMPLTYVRP